MKDQSNILEERKRVYKEQMDATADKLAALEKVPSVEDNYALGTVLRLTSQAVDSRKETSYLLIKRTSQYWDVASVGIDVRAANVSTYPWSMVVSQYILSPSRIFVTLERARWDPVDDYVMSAE